jgi:hypothetical protein
MLKIVLAWMVIGMHTRFFADVSGVAVYLTSNGLFRIAVPIFLLINGYFFYQVLASAGQAKWFVRVLILYGLWMAIYAPFWMPDLRQSTGSWFFKAAHTIFLGYYHLWYLMGMLGAAAVMVVVARAGTRFLIGAAAATFLGGVAIQYIASYHLMEHGRLSDLFSLTWSHRNLLLFSFPFFCTGFLINKHKVLDRLSVRQLVPVACAGLALLLAESYLNYVASSSGAVLDNMLSLAIVCPALFILVMKTNMTSTSKELALYSTAIYLAHILVMFALQRVFKISPTVLTLLTIFVATAVSHVLVRLHRRYAFIL